MGGTRLDLNRRKLVLDAATRILNRSFNNLTSDRKRRFVNHFQDTSSDIDFEDLKMERKLWDIKEHEADKFDRIVIRFSLSDRKLDQPIVFAKAGLTRKIGGESYGLAISYGWHSEFREAGFERNMVMEMNRATNGVKMYYSTPGEKAAIGRIRRPTDMRSYLES